MIGLNNIQKLLESAVLTGFVKNKYRSTSLLLIGEAESGKSELIELISEYPQTIYTSDLSSKPFIDNIMPKFDRGEVSHILIPDFITPLSHRRASKSLISILNNFLAEGLKEVKFYGSVTEFNNKVSGSLITGVTKRIFENRIKSFRDNGFLSRILPVSYKYSELTQEKIHEYIKNEKYLEPLSLNSDFKNFKLNSFNVKIPENIADKVKLIAQHIVDINKTYSVSRSNKKKYNKKINNYGFRLHKQLRALIKGIALYNLDDPNPNNTIIVTEKDFRDLKELKKFINYNFTKI